MKSKTRQGIESFVVNVLERHGGTLTMLRQNAVRASFDASPPFETDEGNVIVAFERKALAHHPDARLAIPGSPFYNRLVDLARSGGGTTKVYTPTVEPRPDDPEAVIIEGGEGLEWTWGGTENHPHLMFNFALTYQSVVTSDDLVSIGYDVVTDRFRAPALIDALHSVWSETLLDSPGEWPEREALSFEAVLPRVLAELDARTRKKVNRARRNAQRHLQGEIQAVEDYYRQLIAEERDILNRVSQTTPAEAEQHEKRIRRYQLDWKRRVAEEARHHECRVHVRLISAAVVYTPRTSFAVRGGSLRKPLDGWFNHFLGTMDGIACAKSGDEMGPWQLTENGEWISRASQAAADEDEQSGELADGRARGAPVARAAKKREEA